MLNCLTAITYYVSQWLSLFQFVYSRFSFDQGFAVPVWRSVCYLLFLCFIIATIYGKSIWNIVQKIQFVFGYFLAVLFSFICSDQIESILFIGCKGKYNRLCEALEGSATAFLFWEYVYTRQGRNADSRALYFSTKTAVLR